MALGQADLVERPWLRLALPSSPSEIEPLALACAGSSGILDVTLQPGLWGSLLRESTLMAAGGLDAERATEETHARDLMQAELIQTLSAIGRPSIDLYFFRLRRLLEPFQLAGALEALQDARRDGHIGILGLSVEGPAYAAHSAWSLYNLFGAALVPESMRSSMAPVAAERETVLVSIGGSERPRLEIVRSQIEVETALGAVA